MVVLVLLLLQQQWYYCYQVQRLPAPTGMNTWYSNNHSKAYWYLHLARLASSQQQYLLVLSRSTWQRVLVVILMFSVLPVVVLLVYKQEQMIIYQNQSTSTLVFVRTFAEKQVQFHGCTSTSTRLPGTCSSSGTRRQCTCIAIITSYALLVYCSTNNSRLVVQISSCALEYRIISSF